MARRRDVLDPGEEHDDPPYDQGWARDMPVTERNRLEAKGAGHLLPFEGDDALRIPAGTESNLARAIRRYWAAWPEHRDAVLDRYAQAEQRLRENFKVTLGKGRISPKTLNAIREKDPEAWALIEFDPYFSGNGGPLGLELLGGETPLGIAIHGEIPQLATATPDEIRTRPPVRFTLDIGTRGDLRGVTDAADNELVVIVAGEVDVIPFANLRGAAAESALEFRAVLSDPAQDRYTENLRSAYRRLAANFWASRQIMEAAPRQQAAPVEPLLRNFLRIPSGVADRAMMLAIYGGADPEKYWNISSRNVPFYVHEEPKGKVEVSIRNSEDSTSAIARQAFEELKRLDDLTCDVFLLHVAHWREHHDEHGGAWITAEAILDERGIVPKTEPSGAGDKRYRAGHRLDDVQEIYSRVQQLERFWITVSRAEVYVQGVKGKKRPQLLSRQGRALLVKERIIQSRLDETEGRVHAWYFQLYDGLGEIVVDEQFAYIARKVLTYDYVRRVPEKRIGRYLAFHIQLNRGKPAIYRLIGTLLDDCGIPCDASNPQRTRDRFEQALNRLTADGVLQDWNYRTGGDKLTKELRLPARGWVGGWRQASLELRPAAAHPAMATKRAAPLAPNG